MKMWVRIKKMKMKRNKKVLVFTRVMFTDVRDDNKFDLTETTIIIQLLS